MADDLDVEAVAEELLNALSLVSRRVRQLPSGDELSLPERTALSRLNRGGPTTSAELARQAQISPQSMGATLAALQARGLVKGHPDPVDGRRVLLSPTESGRRLLQTKHNLRVGQLAEVLQREFRPAELKRLAAAAALLDRLGQHI